MKNRLLLALLTVTCLFSSCSQENEVKAPQDKSEANKVTFIVNTAPVTRTTVNTTDNSTKFVENDKIGIFETSATITDANNYEYKVLSEGTLEAVDASKTLYYPNDANEDINFYAYYPYNQEINTTDKVAFTVAADQSSEALYNANDFMAATATGKKADFTSGVSLTFSHKLALVQLSLIGDDAANVTAVALNNCKPTTTWTFSTNVIEAASGTAQDIKMWKIKADANTYWALVPAQTITTGTILFTMTAGETTYTYKPSASDIVFTANKIKKFNIQLGTNGNTIAVSTNMNANGWDDSESATSGSGEKETPKPIDLLGESGDISKLSTGNLTTQTTWTSGANNTWQATTSATVWSADSKAEVINDATKGNVIHLKYTYLNNVASGWAWYNSTAIYHCVNSAATGETYELSFDAKIGGSATKQILVFLGFSNNGTNTFFTIEDGSTIYARRYINMSTEWNTYKLTVNFGQVSTSTGSSALTTGISNTPSSNWNDFTLGFNAKEVGLDYYITNVSLIKKATVTE